MYEKYTSQSLPEKDYRELLGSAICVFNSNNNFIIENIVKGDKNNQYIWHDLIDLSSGDLEKAIKEIITQKTGNTKIGKLFGKLCEIRNRIVHSFQITNEEGEQILASKNKEGIQYRITKEYLLNFIKLNEKLSLELYKYRDKK